MSRIIVKAPPSARSAYSVVPDPDDPIILQLDGRLSRVLEISAGGFSAPAEIAAPGRRYPYSLDLPTCGVPLGGYVDVLPDASGNGVLQARFVDLSADEFDALHRYVLVRQKEAIRSLRAVRAR